MWSFLIIEKEQEALLKSILKVIMGLSHKIGKIQKQASDIGPYKIIVI
jgi:hypothetical protein